jgi:23S rRNA pseudouridine955/2504/2580 synthase
MNNVGGTGQTDHLGRYLPALKFDIEENPRLIHRLDKEASGLLLLGRTR